MSTNTIPFASRSDPNGYMGTVMAATNLRCRQALTLEHAWAILLHKEDGPDCMPEAGREPIRQLLVEFGYREFTTIPVEGGVPTNLWIRSDWPTDRLEYVPLF